MFLSFFELESNRERKSHRNVFQNRSFGIVSFPSVITNKMSQTHPEHMRSGDTIYITNGVLNKISFTFQINFELNQRNKFKLCIHSGYRNAIFYMYIYNNYIYIYIYMYIFYICTVDQLGQQFFLY